MSVSNRQLIRLERAWRSMLMSCRSLRSDAYPTLPPPRFYAVLKWWVDDAPTDIFSRRRSI